ncbi:hypothetical protein ASZ90_004946 [hydrocarbon metagenome]|uniref:Uncharacterized protein n=1 Tax=hydrocarbon metagenome TaxID=938273 RepID=A0A0W8FWU0_9ZZZZ
MVSIKTIRGNKKTNKNNNQAYPKEPRQAKFVKFYHIKKPPQVLIFFSILPELCRKRVFNN